MFRVILERGRDIHLTDNYGNTSLNVAARSGSLECVHVLTSHEEENLGNVLSGMALVTKNTLEHMGRTINMPPSSWCRD